MVTKLKFKLLNANDGIIEFSPDGELEAPNSNQLVHRFFYEGGQIKDRYKGKTDLQVQEIEHAAAIALATELGTAIPPPLSA